MREIDERDYKHGLADTQQDEQDRMKMAENNHDAFSYQLLGRLQQDCEYYLGFGARHKKHLWAQDEAEQIKKMKEVYAALPEKPEWITLADIEKYEVAMIGVNLAKEERKSRDMEVLSQRHGEQGKTDAELLPSLPGAEVRLNTGTGVIEITHADGAMAYLGDQVAVEQFSKDVGLSAPDKDRLLSLNTLGKQLSEANMALDDIPLVVTGHFVGPVVATKDGVAIQDTGRGNMVGHDMSKFDTPPKAGDKLDARYKNGLVRAVDELSKDNHSVSVSMHTR